MELPRAFAERMQRLLGAEYADFCHAFEEEDAVKGLRVNTTKVDVGEFLTHAPFSCAPIPYVPNGFVVSPTVGAGKHPYHAAGAYYLQDPGAMSAVAAIPDALFEQDGLRVLDLCAAPGGKTTQLASRVRARGGAVLANEYVSARSRILAGNVERMGLDNVVVTNLDASRLASCYPHFFDIVVVDAPCSGEGMYRKNELAVSEWSLENVAMCAARQRDILEHAVQCVAPGGLLVYSTCTYSLEENEETVVDLLRGHPDFHLLAPNGAVTAHTAPGVAIDGAGDIDLSLCRRFYPHRSPGEGQFVALLQRDADGDRRAAPRTQGYENPSVSDLRVAEDFCKETLGKTFSQVFAVNGNLAVVPFCDRSDRAAKIPLVAAGVPIGEVRKGRILPHHHFFMAYGREFASRVVLEPDGEDIKRYLRGEELAVPTDCRGYTAVLVRCGETLIPLGGGKAVDGRLKNYYPKGLRV